MSKEKYLESTRPSNTTIKEFLNTQFVGLGGHPSQMNDTIGQEVETAYQDSLSGNPPID